MEGVRTKIVGRATLKAHVYPRCIARPVLQEKKKPFAWLKIAAYIV